MPYRLLLVLLLPACAHRAAPMALGASGDPIQAASRVEVVRLVSNELARSHGAYAVEVGTIHRAGGQARCTCSYLVQAGTARVCGFRAVATVDLAAGSVAVTERAIQWCEGDEDPPGRAANVR
ncbi:MAG: hypothetical protein JWM80_4219 [Cyanobacteria bacterium RYN_339]|nr:hypothetical protein [Cyanobacteria bacterium RYN_339]